MVGKQRLLSITVASLLFTNVQANNLENKFDTLLGEHNLIKQAQENLKSSKENVELEKSGWYPELSVTLDASRDNYYRSNSANTHLNTTGASVNLTQLLWDFGTLNTAIKKSELGVIKAEEELQRQRQYLMLSGLEAMIDLYSATKKYQFAIESENNIMKQTKLESARITAGSGYTTDLLQAKSQLASAEAKKVEAESNLKQAQNRYSAIFKDKKYNIEQIKINDIDKLLPTNLENAIEMALKTNSDLKVSETDCKIANTEVTRVRRSEWAPKINLVSKYSNDNNPDGSTFRRQQANVGMQISWNFNFGGAATHSERVAYHNANSAKEELLNKQTKVVETTQNAWAQLDSAKKRRNYLGNQVSILNQFLELARKERELGKRSLLDVLTAETSLLNAKSDKMVADAEVLKSKFNLLLQIAKLNVTILK